MTDTKKRSITAEVASLKSVLEENCNNVKELKTVVEKTHDVVVKIEPQLERIENQLWTEKGASRINDLEYRVKLTWGVGTAAFAFAIWLVKTIITYYLAKGG